MTIRFLQSADLHLDAPLRALAMKDESLREAVATASRGALERLVRHCIDERMSALLLAGDVFDRSVQSVNAVAHFARQMERLHEAGVPVFIIRGNHDFENAAKDSSPLPPNVTVFGEAAESRAVPGLGGGLSIMVHGLSYGARSAPGSLVGEYPAPAPGSVNIGLMHTSLSGNSAHDPYAPCTVEALAAQGYDYWALGHIHGRAVHHEAPWVVMPGAPQGRHVNETGPKTATEITLVDGQVRSLREVPTARVVFERVEVAVKEEEAEDLARLCRRALERRAESVLAEGQTLVARVEARGTPETMRRLRRHSALWRERAAQAARELEVVWLEELAFAAGGLGPAPAGEGPVAEIARLMRESAPTPAARHALAQLLEQSLDLLPPTDKKALVPDDAAVDALLERLAAEAVEEMTAALGEAREEA